MSINVSGNILSSTGFTPSGEITNTPNIVTDGLVLWYDAGNLASYNNSSSYYDCGYGCQYYGSNPGCTNCNTQIKDMSGYGNDGTFAGSTFVSYSNIGGSLVFNGPTTYDYVSTSDTLTHKPGLSFSYESWINFNSFTAVDKIFVGKPGCHAGLIEYSGSIRFTVWGPGGPCAGGNTNYTASSSCSINEWNHWVGTYEVGVGIKIYKNGSYVTSTAISGSIGDYGDTLYVGGSSNSSFTSNSYLPIVRTYNKTLSSGEVLQNFNTDRQRFGI